MKEYHIPAKTKIWRSKRAADSRRVDAGTPNWEILESTQAVTYTDEDIPTYQWSDKREYYEFFLPKEGLPYTRICAHQRDVKVK